MKEQLSWKKMTWRGRSSDPRRWWSSRQAHQYQRYQWLLASSRRPLHTPQSWSKLNFSSHDRRICRILMRIFRIGCVSSTKPSKASCALTNWTVWRLTASLVSISYAVLGDVSETAVCRACCAQGCKLELPAQSKLNWPHSRLENQSHPRSKRSSLFWRATSTQ